MAWILIIFIVTVQVYFITMYMKLVCLIRRSQRLNVTEIFSSFLRHGKFSNSFLVLSVIRKWTCVVLFSRIRKWLAI